MRERVLDNWETQDEPEHLKTIRDRILHGELREQLLNLYRDLLQQGEITTVDSRAERELLLSGLAIAQQGLLKPHNRIYQSIFDLNWVEMHLGG